MRIMVSESLDFVLPPATAGGLHHEGSVDLGVSVSIRPSRKEHLEDTLALTKSTCLCFHSGIVALIVRSVGVCRPGVANGRPVCAGGQWWL